MYQVRAGAVRYKFLKIISLNFTGAPPVLFSRKKIHFFETFLFSRQEAD